MVQHQEALPPRGADGAVPVPRGPGETAGAVSGSAGAASPQSSAHSSALSSGPPSASGGGDGDEGAGGGADEDGESAGSSRLRVDARRNLENVLRAAREVFGELGYAAPMEEVARRAGVGVGTVYRRFPSKEALVQRIAAEEVAWLTVQAHEALVREDDAWSRLADFLSRAVTTGAGRLLPPEAFRQAALLVRIPVQRGAWQQSAAATPGSAGAAGPAGPAGVPTPLRGAEIDLSPDADASAAAAGSDAGPVLGGHAADAAGADSAQLLDLLVALVEQARATGALRSGVTIADVVLVLTASAPPHAAAAVLTEPSAPPRLLQLLLSGLHS